MKVAPAAAAACQPQPFAADALEVGVLGVEGRQLLDNDGA